MLNLAPLIVALASLAATSASPVDKRAPAAHAVGLGWNQNSGKQAAAFQNVTGSKFSWYYNWDLNGFNYMGNLEYVPIVWGSGSVSSVSAASKNWASGSYVLSFNERESQYSCPRVLCLTSQPISRATTEGRKSPRVTHRPCTSSGLRLWPPARTSSLVRPQLLAAAAHGLT